MLGGKIRCDRLAGNEIFSWYYINGNGFIDYMHYSRFYDYDIMVYTLEKFLEKFPYKVGDKVQHKGATSCGSVFEVEKMRWVDNHVEYTIKRLWYNNCHTTVKVEDLQTYKEETMEEKDEKIVDHVFSTDVISFDIAQKDKYELDLQGKFEVVLREGKYYVERIKSQFPKTYNECYNLLNDFNFTDVERYDFENDWRLTIKDKNYGKILNTFAKLLICRDAYWKLAGEQMELGKDWKPNYTDDNVKYIIRVHRNHLSFNSTIERNYILIFPTTEMRDAFYENFKDLIEQCKELL